MAYLQIYNRKANYWGDKYPLNVGYQENWVLDKTTDSASDIKIKVPFESVAYPHTKPLEWGIMDWVRIVHEDGDATYNANGTPKNHSQYVISAIQLVEVKRYEYYWVTLELAEPIERFKGIIGEVLTYTNGITVVMQNQPLTINYNHLTALERWLRLTPSNFDNYNTGYQRKHNKSWFNRITLIDNSDTFLSNLPFADTTINGLSLYELLMDIYDSSTGRTPVAYFDIDISTDTAKNTARDEYLLNFERQDGYDKEPIQYDDLVDKASQVMHNKTLDNYATGLISDVENLTGAGAIEYPSHTTYAVPEVDTLDRELLVTPYKEEQGAKPTDYWVVQTPYPIKNILKLTEIEISKARQFTTSITTGPYIDKITRVISNKAIYEEQEYKALNISDFSDNELYWYTNGDNKIHIRKYFSTETSIVDNTGATPVWKTRPNWLIQIEYEPLINARIDMGNREYQLPINQTSSQVDADKYADFLENYLQGMNKADVLIQKTFYNFNEFSDIIGRRVLKDNRVFMVTAVSYKNRNKQYDVAMQLNENHFRKSNSYEAGQEVKTIKGIPLENIKERQIAVKMRVEVGLSSAEASTNESGLLGSTSHITSALDNYGSTGVHLIRPTIKYSASFIQDKDFLLPVTKFAMGNQVCVNAKFIDNTEIGKSKGLYTSATGATKVMFESPYVEYTRTAKQMPIIYPDAWGQVRAIQWRLMGLSARPLNLGTTTISRTQANQAEYDQFDLEQRNLLTAMRELPKYPNLSEYTYYNIVTTGDQLILKGALESINVTFIWEIIAENNGFIIHDNFAKNSSLLSNDDGDRYIRAYTSYKNKNDSFSGQTGESKLSFNENTEQYTYSNTILTNATKCATIGVKRNNNFEPLIIINNADIIKDLKEKKFGFYGRIKE